MKVLIYRYNSICEPDVVDGFLELGFDVEQLTLEMSDKNVTAKDTIAHVSQYLMDHPQDIVFSINFFPALAEVCNIFHIPYLSWIVDSPVLELFTSSVKHPWNRIFVFDRAIYNDISPLNPECVFYLPLAANVRQKQSVIQNASPECLKKYASEIAFVGSMYTEKCAYDRLNNAPEYLTGYLNGLMEAQKNIYGYFFLEEVLPDEIVEDFVAHFPYFYQQPGESFLTKRQTLAQLYMGTKITCMERHDIMSLLSERYSVDIYTGSDVSQYPRIHNRGFAKTQTEMPLIFHEAKINLNTTAKSIRSGLPLRIWDILGCGGFCLTNFQSDLPELFTDGVELATFSSYDELLIKVEYYLSHEAQRQEIAMCGFESVQRFHTYPIRLTQMLEMAFHLKQ